MPQENGWATGAEYIEDNGSHCPYCGHDDPTYAGDYGDHASYSCEKCKGEWKERKELVGWEDSNKEFHEDTTNLDKIEEMEATIKILHAALVKVDALADGMEDRKFAEIQSVVRTALQEGN